MLIIHDGYGLSYSPSAGHDPDDASGPGNLSKLELSIAFVSEDLEEGAT